MFEDPIVLETRRRREEYAASFGYDLDQIVADLAERQGRDGRRVVDRSSAEVAGHSEAGATSPVSPQKANVTPPSP